MAEWIGVDFDGTLAKTRDDWTSHNDGRVGEPIMSMVERVKEWLSAGEDVRIFTARVGPGAHPKHLVAIEKFCQEHFGVVLPVTATKDMHMKELWDDRAVQVIKDVGEPILAWFARDRAEFYGELADAFERRS